MNPILRKWVESRACSIAFEPELCMYSRKTWIKKIFLLRLLLFLSDLKSTII